ncbi:hypothetical protein ACIQZI_15685 [Peribacillus sp. NPDC096379]|uniref:hypothetical protein n=1 Tax=Peribacillus sp. NPDC096379 TaxID=3364393 RepID=UPI0038101F4B
MGEENLDDKENRKSIKIIFWIIIGLALLNLCGMLAPTWLLMATLLSITLFIYENFSKSIKLNYLICIILAFLFVGGLIRLNIPLDALLKGVDPLSCEKFQPTGFFTGGCGPEPFSKPIGPRINDTFALLALAAAVGIHLIKKKK